MTNIIQKPKGWRDNGNQIFFSEQTFFTVEIVFRVVDKKAFRIVFYFRAGIALCLPFFATYIIKKSTMTRKGPTVMKCPDHLFFALLNIFKEYFNIDKVTVDIVQVNNVWINGVQFFDKRFGGTGRTKTVKVKKPGFHNVEIDIFRCPDFNQFRLAGPISPTVSDVALVAFFNQQMTNVFCYAAGATRVYNSINLQDFQLEELVSTFLKTSNW